jgi:23S rRNA pseudouridine2457 synthase
VDHRHFKIYKPYRYLSQFVNNQTKRKNKKLLGELGDFPEGIMAIGRLDEKSEGLLLLTTDGSISEQIR